MPAEFKSVVMATALTYASQKVQPNASLVHTTVLRSTKPSEIAEVMQTEEFALAMRERGIPWNEAASLSDRQIAVIRVISDPSEPGNVTAKLRRLGVKPAEYKEWKQNPLFSSALSNISADVLSEYSGEIQVALANKALDGSLEHIKFLYEITGQNKARGERDFQAAMNAVLNVIGENVKDQATLEAIAAGIDKALNITKEITSG